MKVILFGIAIMLFGSFFILADINSSDFANETLGLILNIGGLLVAAVGLFLPDRKNK